MGPGLGRGLARRMVFVDPAGAMSEAHLRAAARGYRTREAARSLPRPQEGARAGSGGRAAASCRSWREESAARPRIRHQPRNPLSVPQNEQLTMPRRSLLTPAEPKRNGLNSWRGDHEARRAVYNNRIRISSMVGKAMGKQRTELVERSFEQWPIWPSSWWSKNDAAGSGSSPLSAGENSRKQLFATACLSRQSFELY